MPEEIIITVTDARRMFCAAGMRRWAERNGIDFKDFIRNGISVSAIRALGEDVAIDRLLIAKAKSANPGAEESENG